MAISLAELRKRNREKTARYRERRAAAAGTTIKRRKPSELQTLRMVHTPWRRDANGVLVRRVFCRGDVETATSTVNGKNLSAAFIDYRSVLALQMAFAPRLVARI